MKTTLNYLSKLAILFLMFASSVFSQNITNTLGTNGVFTIKDAATNFLTLSQATGQVNILRSLRLENTTSSSVGVLFKGGAKFLHNFGLQNTFLGVNSGNFTMTGNDNIALGYQSLFINTSGYYNTAVGNFSLNSSNTGYYNTAVGTLSLFANNTGFHNTAVGTSSGSGITSGSNLTCLGYNAEPTTVSATNQITLGNNQVTSLRCNVQTITSLSDVRDKKNITDLSLGLDFIMKVKPRLFNWDKREWYENNLSDGSKMKEAPTAGFIAQELDEVQTTENAVWLDLVLKDNPEKLEATYGNLLPVIVKAIQELKSENDMLKERLSKFEQLVSDRISVKYTSLGKTNENKTISK
jgi:hypothetical protein